MIILGIESSCDETAIAIMEDETVLTHKIHSQIALHQPWGGVVPELASRDHAIRMLPLLQSALAEIPLRAIDAFAYTAGPGLIGSLLMGATTANTLAAVQQKPVYPIHHLEGHVLSAMIEQATEFPAIVLLVSGGHSQFIIAKAPGNYQVVGQSIDDAVGECFDKVAKLMGLGYPGGPIIEKLAEQGDANRWQLPRPMLHSKDFNMSFSGLKTAVRQAWQALPAPTKQDQADMAASFQAAACAVLEQKLKKVVKAYPEITTVLLVGGVAANQYIRSQQQAILDKYQKTLICPNLAHCTDNGVMIAKAGMLRAQHQSKTATPGTIFVQPRWDLADYISDWWQ